jgi:hypothetical protein
MNRRDLIQTGLPASLALLTDKGQALTDSFGRDRAAWFGRIEELSAALRDG